MWQERVWNPGPLTYESGALPTALCSPANTSENLTSISWHLDNTEDSFNVSSVDTAIFSRLRSRSETCIAFPAPLLSSSAAV